LLVGAKARNDESAIRVENTIPLMGISQTDSPDLDN
jgi:hypothetical protein